MHKVWTGQIYIMYNLDVHYNTDCNKTVEQKMLILLAEQENLDMNWTT